MEDATATMATASSEATPTPLMMARQRRALAHHRHKNNNPFTQGGRNNFPSLERALATDDPTTTSSRFAKTSTTTSNPPTTTTTAASHESPASSSASQSADSSNNSLDLSIDARAALHEHLRQVAKFGLDGDEFVPARSSARRQEPPTVADDPSPYEPGSVWTNNNHNTLDEEWENILQGHHQAPSSADVSLPTFHRLQVTAEQDNFEVAVLELTCIEADDDDDYFNSSKVMWQLMTPEKNRGPQQPAVTQRHEDADDDDNASNTPESACLVETDDPQQQLPKPMVLEESFTRPSPLRTYSPTGSPRGSSLPFASSPLPVDSLPAIVAAAAAVAQDMERHERGGDASFFPPTPDDQAPAGLQHNSLLATSIHEDLPIITSPFRVPADALLEGSFADWSVASPENSFVVPSAVTPIRPLPPLSPIHSLRGSPSRNSSTSHRTSTGSTSHAANHARGSPRSTASSSSWLARSWRGPTPSPSRVDFAVRDNVASPIRNDGHDGSSSSPRLMAPSSRNSMSPHHDSSSSRVPRFFQQVKTPIGDSSSSRTTTPLSPLAQQAAQAAQLYQTLSPPHHPESSRQTVTDWPAPSERPALIPITDSFESSTTANAHEAWKASHAIRSRGASITPHPVSTVATTTDKDTAPLVSLMDTLSTDKSESSGTGMRSIRSADDALERRRYYRTVVPRRVLFPDDGGNCHGDSFDRPGQSF